MRRATSARGKLPDWVAPTGGAAWWVTVALISVLTFLFAVFVTYRITGSEMATDFAMGYHPGALSIQRGLGYVGPSGQLITNWPPGYSWFLSPWVTEDVNVSVRRARFANGALAAIWVWLLAFLARRIAPGAPIAVVLAIAVFWPPMLPLMGGTGSDLLYAVLTTIGVIALVFLASPRPIGLSRLVALIVLAGFAFGCAILTRTVGWTNSAGCLAAIPLAYRHWTLGKRLVVMGSITVLVCLVVSPWVIVYKDKTGHAGFTSHPVPSITTGRHRFRIQKIAWAWYHLASGKFNWILPTVQIPWMLLFTLASVRAAKCWRRTPPEIVVCHGLVISAWCSSTLTFAIVRFLTPVFPFAVLTVFWHALDLGLPRRVSNH